MAEEIWKTFQDACEGNGNRELNIVSNSMSERQCHLGMDPNDLDGISVMAFWTPAMCNGVSGDVLLILRRRARARISCIAASECLDAIRSTQCTVGELSLKRATCAPSRVSHTDSITSHKRISPAISRSELVMDPFGLAFEMTSCLMSSGHSSLKTVGGTALFSPTMIPPTPCFDASFMPT